MFDYFFIGKELSVHHPRYLKQPMAFPLTVGAGFARPDTSTNTLKMYSGVQPLRKTPTVGAECFRPNASAKCYRADSICPYSGRKRYLSISLTAIGVCPPDTIPKGVLAAVFGRPDVAPTGVCFPLLDSYGIQSASYDV